MALWGHWYACGLTVYTRILINIHAKHQNLSTFVIVILPNELHKWIHSTWMQRWTSIVSVAHLAATYQYETWHKPIIALSNLIYQTIMTFDCLLVVLRSYKGYSYKARRQLLSKYIIVCMRFYTTMEWNNRKLQYNWRMTMMMIFYRMWNAFVHNVLILCINHILCHRQV